MVVVPKLPKTRSGKIARNTIAAMAAGKEYKVDFVFLQFEFVFVYKNYIICKCCYLSININNSNTYLPGTGYIQFASVFYNQSLINSLQLIYRYCLSTFLLKYLFS